MNLYIGTFLLIATHFWAYVSADYYLQEVPPPGIGKSATESSVWENHEANHAIDGKPDSWAAMANGNSNEPAWLRVDLGANYFVTHVQITNTADGWFSQFLENFRILLENERYRYVEQQCSYNRYVIITAGASQTIKCDKPTEARYVKIIKNDDSAHRNFMAIADVKVFTTVTYSVPSNTPGPVIPPSNIVDPNNQQLRELQLSNYQVSQKGTFGSHHANLAIDNNPSTYSIACGNCDHTLNDGFGWWMIDLQKSEPISRVVLTSSNDHYNSKYLQGIKILVSQTSTNIQETGQECYTFNDNTEIQPGTVLTFNCYTQPTWGRYLYVGRVNAAGHRPDAISIAEIKIFTSTSNSNVNIDKNSNSNFVSSKFQMIQSGTWSGHEAYLAMDGNMETYSVADTTLDSKATYYNKPAWWQLDLGTNRFVSAVSIASSRDDTNARYLEEFAIEILQYSIEVDPWLTGSRRCKYYKGGYKTGSTTRYECDKVQEQLPNGRYVLIRRLDVPVNSYGSYRPQVIALAEVQIHFNSR